MRSALISFVRSLSLTGDGAGGFPSAFALNGPACARINMLDKFDLSDEKLHDALDSSPLESLREASPIPTVAEREKSWTHQVNASQATAANTFAGRTETSLGFIERTQCKSRRKTACAVTGQRQTVHETDQSRPHVAPRTFVAMDPTSRGKSEFRRISALSQTSRRIRLDSTRCIAPAVRAICLVWH